MIAFSNHFSLGFKYVVSFIFTLALLGCGVSYEKAAIKSWDLMKNGKIDEALGIYEKEVTAKNDRLLRLMDEGILLRVGGRYQESNQKFFEASRIIEMAGYISAPEQVVTVLTNEKQQVYQGEDFEKVLIHVYLALNFIALKQWDEALVEARKVNEILYKMISEAKRPYELNAFAKYAGGLLFEKDGEENDAFISYRQTLEVEPALENSFLSIRQDLLRLTKKMGFGQEFDEYKKKYNDKDWEAAKESLDKKNGFAVLLFESGKSPRKFSSREQHTKTGRGGTLVEVVLPVAYYKERSSRIQAAKLIIQGKEEKTVALNDIGSTAVKHLKDRMGRAIAKALLTAAVKTGIAVGVGKATGSTELGLLTGLALMLASEADTRSWLLLPEKLQIAKISLPSGTYSGEIQYLDMYGGVTGTEKIENIVIQSFRPTFIQKRSFD